MNETEAVNAFLAAQKALARCGFYVEAKSGMFYVIPQGGSLSDCVNFTSSAAALVLVATGIRIGWEWHIAKVASEPTTSSTPEQS